MSSLLIVLLWGAPALAEESTFEGTEDADQAFEAPEADLSVEIGGAYGAGNTVFVTLNGLVHGGYKWDRNKITLDLGANYGLSKSDADGDGILEDSERAAESIESARKIDANLRYDRFFGKSDSLYVLSGALIDPFAGYALRTHEQFGWSHRFVGTEKASFLGELGADYAQEQYVEGADPLYQDVIAARVMLTGMVQLNESVSLSDTIEAYENVIDFADLRLLNQAAVTAKLSDVFSLKLSHTLTFDNQPVVLDDVALRKLDHTGLVTLVASIF